MNEYNFELANGDTLISLAPLEQNGVDNLSTPRAVYDVNIEPGTGAVTFRFLDDLTTRFIPGFEFNLLGSSDYTGTYTVDVGGSTTTTVGSQLVTVVPVVEQLPLTSFSPFLIDQATNTFYVETATECPFVPTTSIELTDNTFAPANGTYTIGSVVTSEATAITAVDVTLNTWSIAGDFTKFYPVGIEVVVTGNTTTGNGLYTVVSAVFGSGVTVIEVAEDITALTTATGMISPLPSITLITVDEVIPVGVANDGTLTTSPPQAFALTAQNPTADALPAGMFNLNFYLTGDQTALFAPYVTTGCNVLIKNNNILTFNLVSVVSTAYIVLDDVTRLTVRYQSPTTPLITASGVVIVQPITAPYGYMTYNVPLAASSLRLVGKGSIQYNSDISWGEAIQNNLINMLENWASDTPPISPLVGQLWYDTITTQLRFNDMNDVWQGIVTTEIPVDGFVDMNDQDVFNPNIIYTSPSASGIAFQTGTSGDITFELGSTGGLEFSSSGGITFSGTGDILLSTANNNITLTGGDILMDSDSSIVFSDTGVINMGGNQINNLGLPSTGLDAANKSYVDGLASGIIWITPVLDPTLYDDTLTTPPIVNGTVPTSAIELSVAYHKTYIVPAGATGDWATLIGRATQYVFDITTDTWRWIDILNRAVQVNDRFIVFGAPDQGDDLSIPGNLAQGGLTGQTGKIAVVTGVAPYTYSFSTPAEPYAISVTGTSPGSPAPSPDAVYSAYLGYSFTFRGTHGAGEYGLDYQWIQFNGPQALIDGGGLRYTGNILNIGQNTGIIVNANDIELDEGYTDGVYLRLDGTNVADEVNTTGQFISTVPTGTAPLQVASTTNVANLNASSLNGATFASPGPIGSGTPDTGDFTSLSATSFSAGSIGAGTAWNGDIIEPEYGGTGVDNGLSTITIGGDLVLSGAFDTTITVTAATTVTLPTTGTLVGSDDVDTVTNTMLLNSTISGIELGNDLEDLTIGNGLLGTSYNGSAPTTIEIDNTVVATLTDVQTLSGKTLEFPVVTTLVEVNTISATGLTGTENIELLNSGQHYYTADAVANWTFNFRGDSGTTLDSLLTVGQSITTEIMVTNGAIAYYASAHEIDGTPVTPLFEGGTPFAAGTANSVDQYTYKITKTGAATFVVLASKVDYS